MTSPIQPNWQEPWPALNRIYLVAGLTGLAAGLLCLILINEMEKKTAAKQAGSGAPRVQGRNGVTEERSER